MWSMLLVIGFCFVLPFWRHGNFRGPTDMISFCIFVIILGPRLLYLLHRQQSSFPGPTQIRLNDKWCVQYDTLPNPGLGAELYKAHGWVIPMAAAVVIAILGITHQFPQVLTWIYCPILMGVAVYLWIVNWRFRKMIMMMPDWAIADRNFAFHRPLPWSGVREVKIEDVGNDRHRLHISSKTGGSYDLHADIICSSKQADALRYWANQRRVDGGQA
jgi:hypothetical protein